MDFVDIGSMDTLRPVCQLYNHERGNRKHKISAGKPLITVFKIMTVSVAICHIIHTAVHVPCVLNVACDVSNLDHNSISCIYHVYCCAYF